jgi:protein phosphatase 1 regulatory subunit 7
MPAKLYPGFLSEDDIVATTGEQVLENIEEIEVLFSNCVEIASLERCRSLRKLAMIDNGLQRISNLKPVGMTLTSLCLCDQMLTRMENLDLPVLTELMLHRNKLTEISGLDRCPRLRKLWLFQNKITSLSGLQAVPELEECWVQANRVTSLAGIEHCRALVDLGLAGNPVADFVELKRLEDLPDLHSLSLSDIHFGQVCRRPFSAASRTCTTRFLTARILCVRSAPWPPRTGTASSCCVSCARSRPWTAWRSTKTTSRPPPTPTPSR